jgi:ABC-2 type transport system permease protein
MSRATVIARRELSSFFYSPIAYVSMTLFLLAAGFSFWDDFTPGQPAGMRSIFERIVWLLVVIIPVLCMGLLSQEWATGTIETLMTAPLGETEVVLGKFFGSLAFFVFLLLPTLLYVVLLRLYSTPDYGPILAGYLGLFLVGALLHRFQQGDYRYRKPDLFRCRDVRLSVFDGEGTRVAALEII